MNYLKQEFYQILKSDENFFDFIQMNAFDGIWFWNLENSTDKWINPKFCNLLGYEYEELQGNQIQKIVHKEDQLKMQHILDNYIKNKQPVYEDEIRFVDKQGKIVWLNLKALVFDKTESKQHRVLVTHTNITQQHNQKEKLEYTLAKYESLLNNTSIFIIRTDIEGNYSYVNDSFCERLNLDREDIMGKSSLSVIVEEDHQKCIDTVYKCFANPEESFFVQIRKPIFDTKINEFGSVIIYTDWEYRAILDEQKNITEIQCVGMEITDRVLSQNALQKKADALEASEEELRLNIEQLKETQGELLHIQKLLDATNKAAQIGTWELNLNNFTTKWNQITKQIHEVDDNFVSTPENGILFYKEGYSREIISRVFTRALKEGVPFDEQLKIITAKGNEIWIRAIGIPTFKNGKCIEMYGTFQNIDKQKSNEINLQQKLAELEVSQKQLLSTSKLLETCNASANIGTWEYDINTREIIWDSIVNTVYQLPQNIELDTQTKINFFKKGENREKAIQIIKEARQEGKPFDEELELINFRGDNKWVRIIGISQMKNGRCIELYGTFQDITPQKQAELQLQEKVNELEKAKQELEYIGKLLETCNEKAIIGIWEFDLETGVNKIDKIIRQIHEVDENYESSVQKGQDRYVGEDKEIITKAFDAAVSAGVPFDEQLRMITDKGNKKWVRIIGIPTTENGKVVQLYGFIQDITKQKQDELQLKEKVEELEKAQQEIQKIQSKLSMTLEKTGVGLWELNLTTGATFWDEQSYKLFHETKEGFTPEKWQEKIYPKDLEYIVQNINEIANNTTSIFDIKYRMTQKNAIHFYHSKGVLVEEDNERKIVGTVQDITREKLAELELKEKVNELEKAKQEIQSIQNKLTLTLEKTNIGLWEIDLVKNQPYWDKQTRKMFGVTELEEIDIQLTVQKIHADDINKVNQMIEYLILQKTSQYHTVYRTVPIDGKIRYHEGKATLIKDKEGKPISVLGITQDITTQKEYEQIIEEQNKDLANSEQKLRKGIREMYHLQQDLANQKQQLEQIFDAVPAMIYQFKRDKEGNVSFPLVSKGAELILGTTAEQILNNNSTEIFEAIHPEDLLGFQSSVAKSAETMQKWESELRLLKNGIEVWIHASSKPSPTEDGGIVWTGIMQNIDNLKETELKAQQQNKQLQETLNELRETQSKLIHNEKMTTLGQLVASIAHEINTPLGAIRSSNESIEKMLANTLSNLPNIVKILSSQQLEQFNELVKKAIQNNALYTSKEKRAIKYNLIEQFDARKIPQSDRIADILVDIGIHQEKESYEPFIELDDTMQILQAAYEVSIIAKSNDTIKIATQKASKIITTLKDFSRQDHTGEKKPTSINESLQNTLVLYQNQLKYGIEVIREMDNLPLINVYEDELAQVWTNLLHNSIQAIEKKGKIYLTTKTKEDKILISIRDTGKGIAEEIRNKVFEAFFTTKTAGEGSGLGLNIVQKIIEKHEGKIWFETENIGENTGTTFFVELPIQ